MVSPWVPHGIDDLQIWKIAENVLNKQSWTAGKGWSCSLEVEWGGGLKTPRRKLTCYEIYTGLLSASGQGPVVGSCEHDNEHFLIC
jgi:hypothetical protein